MALVDRVNDVVIAIRNKINAMMPRLIPTGGTTGQVLSKVNSTNYNVTWTTPTQTPKITASSTAPSSPATGDVWIDTSA